MATFSMGTALKSWTVKLIYFSLLKKRILFVDKGQQNLVEGFAYVCRYTVYY